MNSNSTERRSLHDRFARRLRVSNSLDRKLVSYQGNKAAPGFRWMKYKEGFSSRLVDLILRDFPDGSVLDPILRNRHHRTHRISLNATVESHRNHASRQFDRASHFTSCERRAAKGDWRSGIETHSLTQVTSADSRMLFSTLEHHSRRFPASHRSRAVASPRVHKRVPRRTST